MCREMKRVRCTYNLRAYIPSNLSDVSGVSDARTKLISSGNRNALNKIKKTIEW